MKVKTLIISLQNNILLGNLWSQGHCSGMTQGMWQRAQNRNLTSKFTRFQLNRASVKHIGTSVTHGGQTGEGVHINTIPLQYIKFWTRTQKHKINKDNHLSVLLICKENHIQILKIKLFTSCVSICGRWHSYVIVGLFGNLIYPRLTYTVNWFSTLKVIFKSTHKCLTIHWKVNKDKSG